eukprot:TRINITY_DN500_c0_g1_i1.p1 TRINITY_DN500_c0_g1~~TRINITY_DN500_c0_g1_i1.p1  ORF type:complete len:223 (-),score=61.42 TRINITY_DN500_c0_g1_i1:154-822(-)
MCIRDRVSTQSTGSYGEGVEHNLEQAERCLKKAADWDDVEAQTQWALQWLSKNETSTVDVSEARGYLEKAANQGGIMAQWHLTQQAFQKKENEEAFKWLTRMAAQGYTPAKLLHAEATAQGMKLPTMAEAQQWYQQKAAEEGAKPHCHHAWGRVQEEMGSLESARAAFQNTLAGQCHLVGLRRLRALARKENWTIDQEVQEALNLRAQVLPSIQWSKIEVQP